jgi:HPt (histidine-containing phosphotransfer) domain-containing protein
MFIPPASTLPGAEKNGSQEKLFLWSIPYLSDGIFPTDSSEASIHPAEVSYSREEGSMLMETYNREQALRCFGDESIFQEAVSTFLVEIDSMLEKVAQSVHTHHFDEVKEKAHWVKGGLVYLHATPSANAARDLEQAADRRDAKALQLCYDRLVGEVEGLKKSLSSTAIQS